MVIVGQRRRIDRWVQATSLRLPKPPAAKRKAGGGLVPYRWYVYPLYRGSRGYEFGKLSAQGKLELWKGSQGS